VTNFPVLIENLPLQERLKCGSNKMHVRRTLGHARAALNAMFPNKWIGKYGRINYPLRSPDHCH